MGVSASARSCCLQLLVATDTYMHILLCNPHRHFHGINHNTGPSMMMNRRTVPFTVYTDPDIALHYQEPWLQSDDVEIAACWRNSTSWFLLRQDKWVIAMFQNKLLLQTVPMSEPCYPSHAVRRGSTIGSPTLHEYNGCWIEVAVEADTRSCGTKVDMCLLRLWETKLKDRTRRVLC